LGHEKFSNEKFSSLLYCQTITCNAAVSLAKKLKQRIMETYAQDCHSEWSLRNEGCLEPLMGDSIDY
jgi:hypothetical protein